MNLSVCVCVCVRAYKYVNINYSNTFITIQIKHCTCVTSLLLRMLTIEIDLSAQHSIKIYRWSLFIVKNFFLTSGLFLQWETFFFLH